MFAEKVSVSAKCKCQNHLFEFQSRDINAVLGLTV